MHFARPLVPATLLRRYKRFLADVALDDGTEVTVHCPNPGAMLGLDTPGARVWLEPTPGPTRKLPFGWRLVELPGGHFAGIDTGLPNRLVAEALVEGRIPALAGYRVHRPEVRYGQENSRVDFHLAGGAEPDAHVEVKNAHLRRTGDLCEFPDCVTLRGTKHLRELASVAQSGGRAVLFFVVQRTDCTRLSIAADLDPGYARAFAAARDAGVEVMAHATAIGRDAIRLTGPLPVA
ncbi:sugar fermentation stimulation protein [Wenxinia marina]|uniref:DNA/RNA nuclease SfsA n=1 Tax=Wenxinia marina TaxID=390641 RepID=UPI0003717477|nr:DNA/RNA nuclease SfsA [Wenxinia marina]GGL56797.1 sugar fermentation stimulation protein [Wenxinia marina]